MGNSSDYTEQLRTRILDVAADEHREPDQGRYTDTPIFLFGLGDLLGQMHGAGLLARLTRPIASVGEPPQPGITLPHWTAADFIARAHEHKGAIAIDFSSSREGRLLTRQLCASANIALHDCIPVLAAFDFPGVYELVRVYREKTLARLDEFLSIGARLADIESRNCLYSNLLFRLTYDRDWLLDAATPTAEEYFSPYVAPRTFRLGSREHFCDCGAFRGPIVARFLAETGWQYQSITAFEPDRENYAALAQLHGMPIPHFKPINKAVSSRRQTLRLVETGTVSSYIGAEGNAITQTTRLDDELEHLSFLKMDVEGFEAKTLHGAARLLATQRPRVAACVYHYAHDLLDVVGALDQHAEGYTLRLRQHNPNYFYDLVLYASPEAGLEPAAAAQ